MVLLDTDILHRRTAAPKAWTGTNPITQRGTTPVQQNGASSQVKNHSGTKPAASKDPGLSDRHAHDRLTFLLGAAFGSTITINTKTGDKFEGIMSGSSQPQEPRLTLKMTKKYHASQIGKANGIAAGEAALVGTGPEHTMSFDSKDITEISISELTIAEPAKLPNGIMTPIPNILQGLTFIGAGSKFQTDTDISRSQNRVERQLQRWMPEAGDETDISLDSAGPHAWDQFETNKRMFGTTSTFDENDYTTAIDRSDPSFKRKQAEADRIAREIERSTSTNAHMREERGQALENDGEDEEDKYSGVRRSERNFPPLNSGAPNTYTPPARRPPTGQATVRGAPVDPAIISAQIARPDGVRAVVPKSQLKTGEIQNQQTSKSSDVPHGAQVAQTSKEITSLEGVHQASEASNKSEKSRSINNSVSPNRNISQENPTENVENKLLDQFKQFANSEKLKFQNQRRAQATQDRQSKLNDLLRFSENFKLKTPIPNDLIGILAKDPAKQEQIIEKAKKEVEETKSAAASPARPSEPKALRTVAAPKFDPSTISPLPPAFGRGRGGVPPHAGRNDRPAQPQGTFTGRGMSSQFQQRSNATPQDRKSAMLHTIPPPIPIYESGRLPPTGPAADQSGISSPHRSIVHTPTSAVSTKFNVKAMEFRPNANAPAFNPIASSNTPSSPSSVQRTRSISRAASPSAFFGSRKPKAAAERALIEDNFNPLKKMKQETEKKEVEESKKLFPLNGGIPPAYSTGPRWEVLSKNSETTYNMVFEKQLTPAISPVQSRSNSTQHIPYPNQVPQHLQNGQQIHPQISTPHRTPSHMQGPHYPHHGDDRMQMQSGSPQVYPSPHVTPGQMVYPSPMVNQAQMAYGQPPYFGGQTNQGPMQMRQYQGTPQFMHTQHGQLAAPVMVQQQSSGPYMAISQSYNPQMPMYSPSPSHAYPQQNGYPSPGRGAPMMMHQNSQQGHHTQQVMYPVPGQGGQMMYQQQGSQMRGYPSQQGPYGSSPHQHHGFPQRAMSNGYGQMPKMMPTQSMQGMQGMPPTGPAQHGGFVSIEDAGEKGK